MCDIYKLNMNESVQTSEVGRSSIDAAIFLRPLLIKFPIESDIEVKQSEQLFGSHKWTGSGGDNLQWGYKILK